MIQNLEAQAPPIPGIRKAAILLITLGEQTSGEILKQMDEEEVEAIGREVARLSSITSEQAETLLEEFYQMTVAHDYVLDRKSTRLNSSHLVISYAVFCLKKKNT